MAIPVDQHDALQVLARSPLGATESIMMAHGFGVGTLHNLVRYGLATAQNGGR
jgi:hypothetical protein